MSATLDAVLQYAGRGWSMFPGVIVGKLKKSHLKGEFSNDQRWGATDKPRVLQRYWRRWPDALIGLPTGRENGFFVVDCDTLKGGHKYDGIANFNAMIHHFGKMPATLMAQSPSGSQHFYFRYPKRLTVCNSIGTDTTGIAPGVDVKGEGGMVIAPPSRTSKGRYRWLNDLPIAEAPAWLLRMICKQRKCKVKVARDTEIEHPDIDLIRYALDVIAEDCARRGAWSYQLWFEICCALRSELGDDGFDLFDNWSSKSPTYTESAVLRKWDNCGHDRFNYTVATIFHFAGLANPSWRVEYEATLWQQTVKTILQHQHH